MEPENVEKVESKTTRWRFSYVLTIMGSMQKIGFTEIDFTNSENGILPETVETVTRKILEKSPEGYEAMILAWSKILEVSYDSEDKHQKAET